MTTLSHPPSGIIEKIQKLQALADRAGTEHEAALAAQRVAELCQQHNLDIGVATLVEEETEASEARYTIPTSHVQAHQGTLAQACDALFNVGSCVQRGRYRRIPAGPGRFYLSDLGPGVKLIFYGLKANVQAALETYRYLEASVESLLHGHIREGHQLKGRADFRSFRMGAAKRIYNEALKARDAVEEHFQTSEESLALVHLGSKLTEEYRERHVRGSGPRRSPARKRDHYQAGFDAGSKVDLHGARSSRMLR